MQCLLCQRPIHNKPSLSWLLSWRPVSRPITCEACWQTFAPIDRKTACVGCGRAQRSPELCQDCRRWPPERRFHNVSLFAYNDAMQAYFQQYKFAGDFRLRRVFAESMQTAVTRLAADCVVVIPVTQTTLTTRGFNQVSGWLTDGTNQHCGLKTVAQTKAVPQSKKSRAQRLLLTQPFALTTPAPRLHDQHVLLVDDIYTTGRTIRHAASLLLENGAKCVTGLTLAR